MLKYLIIQLDDTSTSFCHYSPKSHESRMISQEHLEKVVLHAMKESLTMQVVYPKHPMPDEYLRIIDKMEHIDIVPSDCMDRSLLQNADIVIFNDLQDTKCFDWIAEQTYVIRLSITQFINNADMLANCLRRTDRLNIVFTDISIFDDSKIEPYSEALRQLSDVIAVEWVKEHFVQCNLLTDRMMLDKMNNCNAGDESLTVAPDGKYYICPAFYNDTDRTGFAGNVDETPYIPNQQLYKLSHAPICRVCDAWQCRRCVWTNRNLTLEVNTPGHQQCVISHIERNASRKLLNDLRKHNVVLPETEIPELTYIDPFDKLIEK